MRFSKKRNSSGKKEEQKSKIKIEENER